MAWGCRLTYASPLPLFSTYTVSLTLLKVDTVVTPTPTRTSVAGQRGGLHNEPALPSDHFHSGMMNVWLNWRMLDGCASQWNQFDIKTEVNVSAVSPRVLYNILTPLASPVKNVFFKDQAKDSNILTVKIRSFRSRFLFIWVFIDMFFVKFLRNNRCEEKTGGKKEVLN